MQSRELLSQTDHLWEASYENLSLSNIQTTTWRYKKSVLRLYKLVPTFIEFARQASNMFWYGPLFKKMIVRPASERITDTCRDTAWHCVTLTKLVFFVLLMLVDISIKTHRNILSMVQRDPRHLIFSPSIKPFIKTQMCLRRF